MEGNRVTLLGYWSFMMTTIDLLMTKQWELNILFWGTVIERLHWDGRKLSCGSSLQGVRDDNNNSLNESTGLGTIMLLVFFTLYNPIKQF